MQMNLISKISKSLARHKIITALVILSILSLFYLISTTKRASSPTPAPTPTLLPLILTRTEPLGGRIRTIWTTTAIAFVFNQPVDLQSMSYTIQPATQIELFLSPDKSTLYLRPHSRWEEKINYQIEITGLTSQAGTKLTTKIHYEFEIKQPTNIISY